MDDTEYLEALALAETTEVSGPFGRTVEVLLRRTRAARRISLRVSKIDGRTTLSFPPGVSARELERFLARHRDWLLESAGAATDRHPVRAGGLLPVEGVMRRIESEPGPGTGPVRLELGRLVVPGAAECAAARLRGYLRTLARDVISGEIDTFSGRSGRRPGRLAIRDTRSRWGSCSARGDLMFSWRLIMAPPTVRRYVVAHEVAHLTHLNHSRAFWDHVEWLMPGHAEWRSWLRRNGPGLHRYRFD